jgi:7-keto-8-aminopelargonate synthetase-like enzyme
MSTEVETAAGVVGPRRYRNSEKMLRSADPVWQAAADCGLAGVHVDGASNNRLIVRETGHEFINMCSCSYLGLNHDPRVVQGAVGALHEVGTTGLALATTRIRYNLQVRLEEALEELFDAPVLLGLSCSVLTAGILPLLASGHLTDGEPRVMVFDRFAHFSMAYIKPICADESLVMTCGHNDLDYLEHICRTYPRVTYVGDAANSMGGAAALDGLLDLQDRYGLYLFLDDSHSLSIVGEHGEGFARSRMEMNPQTIIVSSLGKGFGAMGGVAMLGRRSLWDFLQRHAGPVGWSQNMQVPTLGAALASAEIHRSVELGLLQGRLRDNINHFDRVLPTPFAGDGLTVRRITIGEADRAVRMSAELYRRGYYSSAVFFPIVPHGEAGLRIMMRADLEPEQITRLAQDVEDVMSTY